MRPELSIESLLRVIDEVAPGGKAPWRTDGTDRLADHGIDSLATLNIIVKAAAVFELDLTSLAEELKPPETVADLLGLLRALQADLVP